MNTVMVIGLDKSGIIGTSESLSDFKGTTAQSGVRLPLHKTSTANWIGKNRLYIACSLDGGTIPLIRMYATICPYISLS